MHSKVKMESLQAILDLMDDVMLRKAKGRRKQPSVVEMTIAAEPPPSGEDPDKAAPEDDLGDEDARSLAELYGKDDEDEDKDHIC